MVRQTRLVREVHHRVKNNLQVVASLLNLHSRGSRNEEVAAAYASIQRRVDALAVVHRNHYAELEENRGVALKSLITELTANLRATAPASAAGMQIRLDIGAFYVTQDVAVSVAFLITEIAEFGMLCGAGLVSIALDGDGPASARLSIEVDALAGPPDCDAALEERFDRIVTGLARQLRSTLDHDPARGLYALSIAVVGEGAALPYAGALSGDAPAAGARRGANGAQRRRQLLPKGGAAERPPAPLGGPDEIALALVEPGIEQPAPIRHARPHRRQLGHLVGGRVRDGRARSTSAIARAARPGRRAPDRARHSGRRPADAPRPSGRTRTAPPQRAPAALAPVHRPAIAPVGFAEGGAQAIRMRRHEHQADMVRHQAPGPDRGARLAAAIEPSKCEIEAVVRVGEKGRLAPVAALGHVVRDIRARRGGRFSASPRSYQQKR